MINAMIIIFMALVIIMLAMIILLLARQIIENIKWDKFKKEVNFDELPTFEDIIREEMKKKKESKRNGK